VESAQPADQRHLLLVNKEPKSREAISAIAARAGWHIVFAPDLQEALATVAGQATCLSALVFDIGAGSADVCRSIGEIRSVRPELPVLVLSADASHFAVVNAMRAGASDYLIKPVTQDRLLHSLRVVTNQTISNELQPMAEKLASSPDFNAMIGADPVFRRAVARAAKAARGHTNILVQGEQGTGKDMLARAIHASSQRSHVHRELLNIRSLAPDAIASALFGHERTAPGALDRKIGALEKCQGGTLVLDEINRLPLDLQRELAETLSRRRVQPKGALYSVAIDVRVISASNQPLAEMVEAGKFDKDLHRLLSGTFICLPSLRARSGDIPALARHFLRNFVEHFGLPDLGLTEPALSLLCKFDWPGNARQLQGVLFRAALLCKGDALTVENFPGLIDPNSVGENTTGRVRVPESNGVAIYSADGNLRQLADIEADVIRLAIGHYRGHMSEVARRLGVGRSTLYRKLTDLGIEAA
jgi:DNA-binding NtrC family response regulator